MTNWELTAIAFLVGFASGWFCRMAVVAFRFSKILARDAEEMEIEYKVEKRFIKELANCREEK